MCVFIKTLFICVILHSFFLPLSLNPIPIGIFFGSRFIFSYFFFLFTPGCCVSFLLPFLCFHKYCFNFFVGFSFSFCMYFEYIVGGRHQGNESIQIIVHRWQRQMFSTKLRKWTAEWLLEYSFDGNSNKSDCFVYFLCVCRGRREEKAVSTCNRIIRLSYFKLSRS